MIYTKVRELPGNRYELSVVEGDDNELKYLGTFNNLREALESLDTDTFKFIALNK